MMKDTFWSILTFNLPTSSSLGDFITRVPLPARWVILSLKRIQSKALPSFVQKYLMCKNKNRTTLTNGKLFCWHCTDCKKMRAALKLLFQRINDKRYEPVFPQTPFKCFPSSFTVGVGPVSSTVEHMAPPIAPLAFLGTVHSSLAFLERLFLIHLKQNHNFFISYRAREELFSNIATLGADFSLPVLC